MTFAAAPDIAVHHHRPDTRNLEWKSDNVGSKLLQKMGWKEGQAIGKRKRTTRGTDEESNDNDQQQQPNEGHHSSEGLRVKKRATGLGLGATSVPINLGSSHHVADFSSLLQHLNHHHPSSTTTAGGESLSDSVASDTSSSADKKRKKRKKEKKEKQQTNKKKKATAAVVILPTNKSTHSKVRQAKFQSKTEHDMKCIFGTTATLPCAAAAVAEAASMAVETTKSKRKTKKSSSKTKEKKKKTNRSE